MARLSARAVETRIHSINKHRGFNDVFYGTIGAIVLESVYGYHNIRMIISTGGSQTTLFTGTLAECDAYLGGMQAVLYNSLDYSRYME